MKKSSKALVKKYGAKISDVFVFGSYVKGRLFPGDVDICVLFKGVDSGFAGKVYDDFRSLFGEKCHYNWVLIEDILASPLFTTLLFEGYSLLKERNLFEIIGLSSGSIFSYDLRELQPSKKVLFSYALHGKGGGTGGHPGLSEKSKALVGILIQCGGRVLGRGVVFVPVSKSREFRDFLDQWKIEYWVKSVLMTG